MTANDFNSPDTKKCPSHKIIHSFAIDAFNYGKIEVNAYFLTHFHSDHYIGLSKKFVGTLYCSKITGLLVTKQFGIDVKIIELNTPTMINGAKVTFIDANHCPGAVMILFEINSRKILHTGDFRVCGMHLDDSRLSDIDSLYLDTTYLREKYTFPSQEMIISCILKIAQELMAKKSIQSILCNTVTKYFKRIGNKADTKPLILLGTYTIGKEKIALQIAKTLGVKIYCSNSKMKILELFDDYKNYLTSDQSSPLHIVGMQTISKENICEYVSQSCFDTCVALKPTGWSYKGQKSDSFGPRDCHSTFISSKISLLSIPYSEHSSFDELKVFYQKIRPKSVVPTVFSNSNDLKRMNRILLEWDASC